MDTKNILVIGRRGRGKSSLANLIQMGEKWTGATFKVSHGEDSVKAGVTRATSTILPYRIIDTPGFDPTLSEAAIVKDIQDVIISAESIHGVLFVMQAGRADDWDKIVFGLLLKFVLGSVPEKMIGVVFTRASDDCVQHNSWDYYRQKNSQDVTENTQKLFLDLVIERCKGKVCFVDNACPANDQLVNRDVLRKKSLENVKNLVQSLDGIFSYDNIFEYLDAQLKYWIKWMTENPLGLTAGVVVPLCISLGVAVAKKKLI